MEASMAVVQAVETFMEILEASMEALEAPDSMEASKEASGELYLPLMASTNFHGLPLVCISTDFYELIDYIFSCM